MNDRIEFVINDWDPIDLLTHSPRDEYQYEIEKIIELFAKTNSPDVLGKGIFEIFIKSFGENVFTKSLDECIAIAQLINSYKS